MEATPVQSLDNLDETALWLRLNAAKLRLALATDLQERIDLRNEIGDLSQRIRKAQRREVNHAGL
jgi:hypothetical protein